MNIITVQRTTSFKSIVKRVELRAVLQTVGGITNSFIGDFSCHVPAAIETLIEYCSLSSDQDFHNKIVTVVESMKNNTILITILTIRSQCLSKSKWCCTIKKKFTYEIGCSIIVLDVDKIWFIHNNLTASLENELPRIATIQDEYEHWKECTGFINKVTRI